MLCFHCFPLTLPVAVLFFHRFFENIMLQKEVITMAFCSKCGASLEENAQFCAACGAPVAPAAQPKPAAPGTETVDFSDKIASLNNTADTTDEFDPNDIAQNKAMAILAYLSWLVLIPLFAAKESRFARFHVNQGLVLAITEAVFWVAQAIICGLLYAISFRLGLIISTILNLCNLIFLALLILGIVNAASGRAKELPVIGKIRLLK